MLVKNRIIFLHFSRTRYIKQLRFPIFSASRHFFHRPLSEYLHISIKPQHILRPIFRPATSSTKASTSSTYPFPNSYHPFSKYKNPQKLYKTCLETIPGVGNSEAIGRIRTRTISPRVQYHHAIKSSQRSKSSRSTRSKTIITAQDAYLWISRPKTPSMTIGKRIIGEKRDLLGQQRIRMITRVKHRGVVRQHRNLIKQPPVKHQGIKSPESVTSRSPL